MTEAAIQQRIIHCLSFQSGSRILLVQHAASARRSDLIPHPDKTRLSSDRRRHLEKRTYGARIHIPTYAKRVRGTYRLGYRAGKGGWVVGMVVRLQDYELVPSFLGNLGGGNCGSERQRIDRMKSGFMYVCLSL